MGARVVQRARRREDKEARRRTIMEAALALFEERRFAEVKMIDVARAANLAKGTVFLYFPTKEALFLDILEELLVDWLDEVNRNLDSGKGRWTSARVRRILTETLVPRDSFIRLLGLITNVLEENVDVKRVVAFKRRLLDLLNNTGGRLERRLDFLGSGEGAHLILQIYAAVVGVKQLTDPGQVAREALQRPELESLNLDFETELREFFLILLNGLERRAEK
ncbi:MAG: TetR family transcriptional regulator [Proteobacteria bacterium]|nr:TetR family transcriptional regulator [Pseudomonadota bacterium]